MAGKLTGCHATGKTEKSFRWFRDKDFEARQL